MRTSIVYRFFTLIVAFILLIHVFGEMPVQAAAPFDPSQVVFRQAMSGLTQPVFLTHAGDGSGRLFVVERAGRIRIFKDGNLLSTPFLAIDVNHSGSEQGLLALAFHPNYKTNRRFYTVHTRGDGALVLSRFVRSAANPDRANAGSRLTLLTIPHPTHQNHNGGTLAFGPDGYLYWSTGDGGGGGDPFNNAQNRNSLLGKILRLDVDHTDPGKNYAIPTSNPFYNMPNRRGEIWAYGLRNPWRLSFDRQTGDLFIGDVGQGQREEIDFQSAGSAGGQNYGWRVMEGSLCYNPSTGCNQSGKVLPVAEYSHSLGCSVTGGYIYRGAFYPDMQGQYFYGDFCSGVLFSLYDDPVNGWTVTQVEDTPYNISTFGQDEQGELYFTDYGAGTIYQICYAPTTDFAVEVAGAAHGSFSSCPPQVLSKSFPRLNTGPVEIRNLDNLASLAAERVIYKVNGVNTSFTEMMGLPDSQLDKVYWLPWYNSKTLDTQLRIANVSGSPASVRVVIGTQEMTGSPFIIPVGGSVRKSFPNVDKGPVKIESDQNIVASERVIYTVDGAGTSFSEMMALPEGQLSAIYWLPWYNNVSLTTQLRLGNASGSTASVRVWIGTQEMTGSPFTLTSGQAKRVSFVGINGGPVKIESDQNIVASARVFYSVVGAPASYSEMMALPSTHLGSTYWLPWYNNVNLTTQLRFANVGGSLATVHVLVGGEEMAGSPFTLADGAATLKSYPGVNSGPVKIESDVDVVVSARVIYRVNNRPTSLFEIMSLPAGQLDTTYWLPWYNNLDVNTQLLFGVP